MKTLSIAATALIASFLLAACGGGGSGSGGGGGATTFNLDEAFRQLHAQGELVNLRGAGDCAGAWVHVLEPARSRDTSFEGTPALSATQTNTTFVTSECPLPSAISIRTAYYDTNYVPLGYSGNGEHAVYGSPPNLPNAANVGDRGAIGVIDVFGDAGTRQALGREEVSYAVDRDPSRADGAIVTIVTRRHDPHNVLTSQTQHSYSIAANAPLTLAAVSFDDIRFGH
jgi:hypothetical protein